MIQGRTAFMTFLMTLFVKPCINVKFHELIFAFDKGQDSQTFGVISNKCLQVFNHFRLHHEI